MSGASVWPTKMLAEQLSVSAPLVRMVKRITQAMLRTTSCMMSDVIEHGS